MSNLKRAIVTLLALAMLTSCASVLSGCGKNPDGSDSDSASLTVTEKTPQEPEGSESGSESESESESHGDSESASETATDSEKASGSETSPSDSATSAAEKYRTDNFAAGKLKESVSDGVLGLISCCDYYNYRMKLGASKGEKWVYSNSSTYVPQRGYFDDMVTSGKFGANCASPLNWAFIDMGIMPSSLRFYGGSSGEFANRTSVEKYVEPVCEIYDYSNQNIDFKTLLAQGKIKAGDIFLAKHHTFIYRGDNTFYAAGHDGDWHTDNTASTEDERHAVFDSWICDMSSNSNYSCRVYFHLRLKEGFVPKYYRNAKGVLVENPAYDASSSLIYNPSDYWSYENFGRENVLGGVSFSKSKGFNLAKLADPKNLTDGQVYYDNTTLTYSDIRMSGGSGYAVAPKYWFDANGNRSDVRDEKHKYLCGFYTELADIKKVDGFSVFSQNVGASSGTPIGDIDGFDILVSVDGQNWTVVYSVENATAGGKWTDVTDKKNFSSKDHNMTHYIKADFDGGAVEAKYIMFALKAPRSQDAEGAKKYGYSILASSADYFRLSEIQVYEAKQ